MQDFIKGHKGIGRTSLNKKKNHAIYNDNYTI